MVASPRKRPNSTSSSNGRGSKKAPVEILSEDSDVASVKDDVDADDDEDDDDEEAEEYEIEAIREHREDTSNPGYLEYLIKWKGYPERDNTWEPEENAKNSQAIIDAYWKKKPAKSQPHKFEKESKKKSKRRSTSRASASVKADDDDDDDQDAEERGAEEDEGSAEFLDAPEDVDDDEAAAAPPPSKRRRGASAGRREAATSDDVDDEYASEEERQRQISMLTEAALNKYKRIEDWESLVEGVETMERGDDGVLMARLIFKKEKKYSRKMLELGEAELAALGPQLWVRETVASKKCPQKVLQFYRDHLRFSQPSKTEEEEEEEEEE
ncbi:uncharacterized protein PFL1_06507 [Pseudozyma flocculosa PF-1]|uniref:Chromo domain-containing protein n=2 Tax=Pseudozyma flocculosa TaxID=84751 RepID=A0A5C3F8T6_9BASI|nr:uncharacterized protein PFL1_06507 [Pseudozyma flocculosa PF-1]EPQ25832.1 hypothetical protein PFL1_06507 [Pseudozyma flocculosa PF-1]SPO40670.1 uncharacterized protein PSFLO_06152 [Pseudozyma flocculosa]